MVGDLSEPINITDEDRATIERIAKMPTPSEVGCACYCTPGPNLPGVVDGACTKCGEPVALTWNVACRRLGLEPNDLLRGAGWSPCFSCARLGKPGWHRDVAPYDCKTTDEALKEFA